MRGLPVGGVEDFVEFSHFRTGDLFVQLYGERVQILGQNLEHRSIHVCLHLDLEVDEYLDQDQFLNGP